MADKDNLLEQFAKSSNAYKTDAKLMEEMVEINPIVGAVKEMIDNLRPLIDDLDHPRAFVEVGPDAYLMYSALLGVLIGRILDDHKDKIKRFIADSDADPIQLTVFSGMKAMEMEAIASGIDDESTLLYTVVNAAYQFGAMFGAGGQAEVVARVKSIYDTLDPDGMAQADILRAEIERRQLIDDVGCTDCIHCGESMIGGVLEMIHYDDGPLMVLHRQCALDIGFPDGDHMGDPTFKTTQTLGGFDQPSVTFTETDGLGTTECVICREDIAAPVCAEVNESGTYAHLECIFKKGSSDATGNGDPG